jgi:hypothetical protein
MHCHGREVAVFVKPSALANRLFKVLGPNKFTVIYPADFKPETIGAQIHCGEAISRLHEGVF